MKKTKVYHYLILFLLIFSVLLKIALAFHWRDSFFNRGNNYSITNPIAVSLIRGDGFSLSPGNPTFEHEFFYPVFVAFCYWLFGYNWFGVALFQSIISALTGLLIYVIANKLFNENVAIMSLLLTLFHPYLFIQSISVADTTLFTFLLVLSCWQVLKLSEHNIISNAILVGIFSSLLILTRDSGAIFVMPLLLYILINTGIKRRIVVCFLILATMFVLILPWLTRNYFLSKKILLSSHGYEVLWKGNNPYSWHYLSKDISVDEIPKPQSIKELHQKYEQRTLELVIGEDSVYLAEVRHFVIKNPKTFLKLMFLKFIKFWSWVYNPNPKATEFISISLRSFMYGLYFLPVLVFSITGIILSYSKNKAFTLFCLFFFVCFSLIHMLSVGFTRLRVPLDPLLTIFASYGFWRCMIFLIPKLRNRRHEYCS